MKCGSTKGIDLDCVPTPKKMRQACHAIAAVQVPDDNIRADGDRQQQQATVPVEQAVAGSRRHEQHTHAYTCIHRWGAPSQNQVYGYSSRQTP